MLIDSHCHINHIKQRTPEEIIDHAKKHRVTQMLSICVEKKDIATLIALTQQFPEVKASIGIHPCDVQKHDLKVIFDEIEAYLDQHPNTFIGIGETGLDYYHTKAYQKEQHIAFIRQIQIAKERQKPLIVHSRSAPEDTVAILKDHDAEKVIIHCFTEQQKMAQQCLELGYTLSFSGIITFKSAQYLRDIIADVPLDQLLVETDSPYLAPVPFRGKENQPAHVLEVAKKVAEIKNKTLETIAEKTSENFKRLFGWPV